ncbi:platelet glycoprotein Ib alpha chain-like [Macrosteles quadrilineatus]|uniref:platelet glycoprotein Ib alpha chain-like n=1 Tax=Macrosteles quadrilineatus TaxID=74068 RepID=UPI0023E0AEB3|nr:platelet glycoprotein Ib alpha chain-like [Macrosteles quadrilineatus]XP_054265508.1 platelet glycoprotein Ib alpha chain-like [Macrosteles quadrilineatus]
MDELVAAIKNLPDLPDPLQTRFRASFSEIWLPSRTRQHPQQTTDPAPTPSTTQASEPVNENPRVLPRWMQTILEANQPSPTSGWLSVRRTPSSQASTHALPPPTPTSSRRPNIWHRRSEQTTSRPLEEGEDVVAFPPPRRNQPTPLQDISLLITVLVYRLL